MIVGFMALVIALSGTAGALPGINSVDSRDIENGQVKRKDIAKNAVNGRKVANGSLRGADVRDGSLTPADFSGSVQGPKATRATRAMPARPWRTERAWQRHAQDDRARDQQEHRECEHPPTAATGVYCFQDLPFTVRNAMVSAENSFARTTPWRR